MCAICLRAIAGQTNLQFDVFSVGLSFYFFFLRKYCGNIVTFLTKMITDFETFSISIGFFLNLP